MSESDEYQAAFEAKLLEDALAKIHHSGVGTFDWFQVVDWTVKGILQERLDRLRREAARGQQIEGTAGTGNLPLPPQENE